MTTSEAWKRVVDTEAAVDAARVEVKKAREAVKRSKSQKNVKALNEAEATWLKALEEHAAATAQCRTAHAAALRAERLARRIAQPDLFEGL